MDEVVLLVAMPSTDEVAELVVAGGGYRSVMVIVMSEDWIVVTLVSVVEAVVVNVEVLSLLVPQRSVITTVVKGWMEVEMVE